MKQETVITYKTKLSCSGGEGQLGHPLVYLAIGEKGEVVCPYCSKKFILEKKNG